MHPALERMGASDGVRGTVADFADRYVARGRCPADDLPDPDALTDPALLTEPGLLDAPGLLTGPLPPGAPGVSPHSSGRPPYGRTGDAPGPPALPPHPGKAASA